MTKDVLSFRATDKICDVATRMFHEKLDAVPVVNDRHEPVGIVRVNDFLATFSNGMDINSSLGEITSRKYETIQSGEPLESLFNHSDSTVFVLNEDNTLAGIVQKDVLKKVFGDRCLLNSPYIKAIFNNIYSGILAIDTEYRIILCNSFAEKVFGVSAREIIGTRLSEFYTDELLTDVLKTGECRDDGKKDINGFKVTQNAFPVMNNGTVIGALLLLQDVSDKNSLAMELERVKALNTELDGIIDSSYDGICVTDDKGKMLRINKSYSRISGIPYERLQKCLGNYVGDLEKSRESYRRGTPENSLLVLANQKPTSFCKKLFKVKDLVYTGNPIFDDDGNVYRVVWNIRDISELNVLKREILKSQYITARYATELEELRARSFQADGVVIHSIEMKKVMEMALRVANVDTTVLITGETGVGKDVISKIIHNASERRNGPFISVNCGAIPENLLESELFGYESGAFTGAKRNGKVGLLEAANDGTILLDEIGDLPAHLQVKILQVLQDQKVVRVGGTKPIKLNIRILAATNKNLKNMVRDNLFREDLYYRLNVIPINIPPLRDRKEDIIPLTRCFVEKFCNKYKINREISQDVFEIMENYRWPGNIRELENFVERVLIISKDPVISHHNLTNYFENSENVHKAPIMVNNIIPLKDAREMLEKEILNKALSKGLSTRKVAEILKVDHSTIVRKINKYKSQDKRDDVMMEDEKFEEVDLIYS